MVSSLTFADAKDELEKLITCGSVQYVIDDYIGVVKNNYVLFPNDNHKYRYNRDKLISNKLFLKISDHLYTMSSNVKNKNTPTISDTLDVDLKFDKHPDWPGSWVNKDKFLDFEAEYNDTQDNSALNSASDVEFAIHITLRHVSENPSQRIEHVEKIRISMTTVLGGINGVKLFIKKKIMEMIYAYEGSGYEIVSMTIVKLYIQKKRQQLKVNFKEIKMYGTLFNYNGFGLKAIKSEVPNSCVPEYLLKLYNNPNEKNPRKRLVKLTIEKILKELNMNSIDDGCSIEQIAIFCEIHKITYYALNYKIQTI